jgi:hypothetical protein
VKDSYPAYAKKVLKELGIERKSLLGELLVPGINHERGQNKSVSAAIHNVRNWAAKVLPIPKKD